MKNFIFVTCLLAIMGRIDADGPGTISRPNLSVDKKPQSYSAPKLNCGHADNLLRTGYMNDQGQLVLAKFKQELDDELRSSNEEDPSKRADHRAAYDKKLDMYTECVEEGNTRHEKCEVASALDRCIFWKRLISYSSNSTTVPYRTYP